MRLAGGVLVVGLLLGACSESPDADPEPAGEAPAEVSEEGASPSVSPGECFEPSLASLQVLAGGITVEGATLGVNAIAAEDEDGLFYLAGELEGGDFEGTGDIAVWATTEDPAGEALDFIAVNDLAIEESDWEPEADVDTDDPAVADVMKCVKEALQG